MFFGFGVCQVHHTPTHWKKSRNFTSLAALIFPLELKVIYLIRKTIFNILILYRRDPSQNKYWRKQPKQGQLQMRGSGGLRFKWLLDCLDNVSKLAKLFLLKTVNAQQIGWMWHSPSRILREKNVCFFSN